MAYNFGATPLDDIIVGVGSANNFVKDKILSKFDTQRRISDLNVTRAYMEHTPFCVDKDFLDSQLAKVEIPTQPLLVDYMGRGGISAGNSLVQTGFSGGKTQRYQVVISDPIVQKYSITRENLKRFDFLGSNAEPGVLALKVKAVKMDAFMNMFMTILDRLETATVAHLNANIATGGGAGTVYPAGAINLNTKEIPLAGRLDKYTGIYTEAMQNKFLYGDGGLMLLSNTTEFLDYNILKALKTNNASDQNEAQLSLFDFRRSLSLDSSVGATYSSLSYLIKRGGVGITSYTQDMAYDGVINEFDVANNIFAQFESPNFSSYGIDVASGISGLKFNYFEERSVLDTNATNLTEESFLDKGINMTMWLRPVFLVAQSEVAGDTPIIQYGQLSA